jgi:hypothetical protein
VVVTVGTVAATTAVGLDQAVEIDVAGVLAVMLTVPPEPPAADVLTLASPPLARMLVPLTVTPDE